MDIFSRMFLSISARFIANRASYKFNGAAIDEMLSRLTAAIREEGEA